MVVTCCVIGCSARADRDKDLCFFSIPAVLTHQGKITEELSRKRRTAWIGRIGHLQGIPLCVLVTSSYVGKFKRNKTV